MRVGISLTSNHPEVKDPHQRRTRGRARGEKLGRHSKLTPHQKREAIARRERGDETLANIGRSYKLSGWAISRLRDAIPGAAAP